MSRQQTIDHPLKRCRRKALTLAVAGVFTHAALANPLNPTVTSGTATFATSGNTLTVTNSPNAIIQWQQFNIGANETTRFLQQSAQSAVLNRINDQNASQILGTLRSEIGNTGVVGGAVYLVNPNGVMFGQNAVIDVGSLVVSSLNLSDANFLANRLQFDGGGFGDVTNLGAISTALGGSVYLIGKNVTNEGVITTPQGKVMLAAGNSVSMIDTGGPELSVTVSANGNQAVNLGTITAAGGRIDMFGALIEQAGILRADTAVVDDAGRIVLKASDKVTVSGEISATSSAGKGGEVRILGNEVTLTGTARIDVSGATGGGTVLVGGDYQGKNADIQNAQLTTIEAGASILADATANGNGGKVIVWADDKAVFDGFIAARGGANGGDGGFVETSGKNGLSVTGSVNTLAPKGKVGTWLLDPAFFCIDNDADSFGTCYGGTVNNFSLGGGIDTSFLVSNLNSTDISLVATDYIRVAAMTNATGELNSGTLTRANATLSLSAPYVEIGAINASATTVGLNVNVTASGTSTTYGGSSGFINFNGNGMTLGPGTTAQSMILKADNQIQFTTAGTTLNAGSSSSGYSLIHLIAPTIARTAGAPSLLAGSPSASSENGEVLIETNNLPGATPISVNTYNLGIKTYTAGFGIYLGTGGVGCGTTNLCLTTQITNNSLSAADTGIVAGSFGGAKVKDWNAGNAVLDGAVTIGSGWGVPAKNQLTVAGKSVTMAANVNASSVVYGGFASSTDSYPLEIIAYDTFTNPSYDITNMPSGKYWDIAVGNYAGSTFGPLATNATVVRIPGFAALDDYNFPGGINVIADMQITDLCAMNPSACAVGDPKLKDLQDFTLTDFNVLGATAAGLLTFDANLNITGQFADASRATGTSSTGGSSTAKETTEKLDTLEAQKRRADAQRARQEFRAVDERKTPVQLRREAEILLADARKASNDARRIAGDVRKVETEARKADADARRAETEHRRAEGEARRADDVAKRAEGDVRKHEADARQADSEAKSATTPVARANAEARRSEAEGRKIDAESRKSEAQHKQAVADSKQREVEHKRAESQSKQREADSKRSEADSKQAEADSKKADADSKIALAEAKQARTPQQKAAAERRAEDKRIEAVQKKAEASVKKDSAEVKKADAEAKKAESEHKRSESDAKKSEADGKKAETESKQSEAKAKKHDADGKKAEAEGGKAKQKDAEQKKGQEEKKAEQKQKEAEQKKAEAEQKQKEAAAKKAEAEQKKAEAEKKEAARKEEALKAFARTAVAELGPDKAAEMMARRHEFKTETLKPALSVLERNPKAADLPACGAGGGDVCIPPKPPTPEQVAQQVANLPPPRIPAVSFLPQVERKIAVVVAINDYKDEKIPPLETAVPDGEAVGRLMGERLGYDVRVIKDGGKADIVRALNRAARDVGPNDSVTVYYAGHGYQMTNKDGTPGEGFWIPADGTAKDPGNWISNADVSKLLGNIPAKQVMLISDSCYSGAFTKEQKVTVQSTDPKQLLANRSVVVMSSGGEEPVSDEGKDGHSIFAWSLMNSLRQVDKFDTGGKLYEGIRKSVIEEFPQVPQYGAAGSAGHAGGGDYLFESRKY